MRGWATLQTPQDLARKVQRDLKRLESSPADVDAAFDFFLTAFHVLDWVHPDSKAEQNRLRQTEPLLDIIGHLCNGAKHFEATRWNQVADLTSRGRYWAPGYWARDFWPQNFWARKRLMIKLS